MTVLRIASLPDDPLAAAATFHALELPRIVSVLAETRDALTIAFDPADHRHRGWRCAAVQSLARARAPGRVNAVASADEAAVAAASAYLAGAAGVTGQYWALDAAGADGA